MILRPSTIFWGILSRSANCVASFPPPCTSILFSLMLQNLSEMKKVFFRHRLYFHQLLLQIISSFKSHHLAFKISAKTACAAHTLLPACCVTMLFGPSRISSLNSTFLLTGRQCMTFALLVSCIFFLEHPLRIVCIYLSIVIISAPVFHVYKICIF